LTYATELNETYIYIFHEFYILRHNNSLTAESRNLRIIMNCIACRHSYNKGLQYHKTEH